VGGPEPAVEFDALNRRQTVPQLPRQVIAARAEHCKGCREFFAAGLPAPSDARNSTAAAAPASPSWFSSRSRRVWANRPSWFDLGKGQRI